MTEPVAAVMIVGVLLLASCSSAADEESAPPTPAQGTEAESDQDLDAALDEADLALTELDDAMGGGVYKDIRHAGRGVDISTTLPATEESLGRAVDLCTTAASVVDGYRVSVDARNGRLLAFKIHDRCQRVHLKATTTLWSVMRARTESVSAQRRPTWVDLELTAVPAPRRQRRASPGGP